MVYAYDYFKQFNSIADNLSRVDSTLTDLSHTAASIAESLATLAQPISALQKIHQMELNEMTDKIKLCERDIRNSQYRIEDLTEECNRLKGQEPTQKTESISYRKNKKGD